ncbi:MAG: hypothetical protein Q8P67_20510, partial [archaeon]|nr:hypothetical protein [archaeon]
MFRDDRLNEEYGEELPLVEEHGGEGSLITGHSIMKSGFGGRFPSDRRFRVLFAWSVSAFMMFFMLVFFAWLWVVVLFDTGFHDALVAQAVISSPKSLGYPLFVTSPGASPDLPPFYEAWYFFNLTNADDVRLRGHHPHVEQLGPYIYSMVKLKYNISWNEDGSVISFRECESWNYEPALTQQGCPSCDPDRDIVVNVNPGYIGAVASAGGELLLTQGFTGPAMARVFTFLETTFATDTEALHSTAALAAQEASLQGPSPGFFATWANATEAPSEEWNGMLVSFAGTPSGISLEAAQQLFTAGHPYSLLSTSTLSYQAWGTAAQGVNATSRSAMRALLEETFGLSEAQVAMLCTWLRLQFWPLLVEPPLLSQFGVPCLQMLAYVQWGTGNVTPTDKKGHHVSVQSLYPDEPFLGKPEFALWADSQPAALMSWQDAVKLWGDLTTCSGPPDLKKGLFNANNWAAFALYGGAPANMSVLEEVWGITSAAQLRLLELYFADMADKFAQPYMVYLDSIGGGLITARSAGSWAFQAIDPLVLLLKPLSSDVALQPNVSTDFQCFHDISTRIASYDTGKNDISMIANTLSYGGMTEWPLGWYNTSYPQYQVHGVNSEGQFQPFLPPNQDLLVFDNNFMRTLTLNHIENVTIQGVDAYRYTISPSNFYAPDYRFSINDPKFQGFANVTGPKQGGIFSFSLSL